MEDLIQELQGSVQVDFNPAGSVLDALAGVVRAPALDEAEPEDAQAAEVVDANAGRS